MKKVSYLFLIATVISIITACNKTDETTIPINPNNLLLGVWINSQYLDTTIIMTRSLTLNDTTDGYEFKADGTLIKRANSGGCGTPPITYANYSGTWTAMPDKTILIETEYWGGSMTLTLEILKVDETKLVYHQTFNQN